MSDDIEFGEIQERCAEIDGLLHTFRQLQTEFGSEQLSTSDGKAGLRRRLDTLRDQLDRYLAVGYNIPPEETDAYQAWRHSHRPFHWFAEFYGIMNAGGFNVVIGNPPWKESDYERQESGTAKRQVDDQPQVERGNENDPNS